MVGAAHIIVVHNPASALGLGPRLGLGGLGRHGDLGDLGDIGSFPFAGAGGRGCAFGRGLSRLGLFALLHPCVWSYV